MLTKQQQDFIAYWAKNRDRQKKTFRQFLIGIPVGLLFAVPIFLNFISGWYKRAAMERNTGEVNPGVLIVALLIIVAFIAIFSKKHQWDLKEQQYLELLAKQDKEKKEKK